MNKYKIIFNSELTFTQKVNKAEELAKHEIQKTIDKNIKDYFKGSTIWSEFENKTLDEKGVKSKFYYYDDLSIADFKNDWRFCKVKNKREQAEYLGLVCQENNRLKIKQNHIKTYNKYLEQLS